MGPLLPTRGVLRVTRGFLLALTSAVLAVAAHTAAGGMLPDLGMTLLLTLGFAAGATALADRRRGPVAVTAGLGVTQLGMHELLNITSHVVGRHDLPAGGWLMTGAHVLAVLVAAVVLAGAESALFTLAGALALWLPRRLTPLPVPATAGPLPAAVPPAQPWRTILLCRCAPRRGPPVTR